MRPACKKLRTWRGFPGSNRSLRSPGPGPLGRHGGAFGQASASIQISTPGHHPSGLNLPGPLQEQSCPGTPQFPHLLWSGQCRESQTIFLTQSFGSWMMTCTTRGASVVFISTRSPRDANRCGTPRPASHTVQGQNRTTCSNQEKPTLSRLFGRPLAVGTNPRGL